MRTLGRILVVMVVATFLHGILDLVFGIPASWVRTLMVALAVTPLYYLWVFKLEEKPEDSRG